MAPNQMTTDQHQPSAGALSAEVACSAPSERDKAIWRAALTLAHNMCVQTSNRINDDDGSLEVVHALSDEAKRICGWMKPTDEQLVEMFTEAGVPNASVSAAVSGATKEPKTHE